MTCVLTDKITKKKFLVSQEMPANKPKVFHFKKLDPDRRYLITFEGIKNPEERAGTLTTLPSKISKIGKPRTFRREISVANYCFRLRCCFLRPP